MNNKSEHFDGSIYYSKEKPKGSGKTSVMPNLDKAIDLMYQPGADSKDVKVVQGYLRVIGYLDEGGVDGDLGDKTVGAIRRYRLNTSKQRLWDDIKDKWDFTKEDK